MKIQTIAHTLLLPAAMLMGLATSSGCAAFKLKPPTGFAEVDRSDDGSHMKANNDVGLRVHVFHNVRGGDLTFWASDLVEKLGKRSYTLTGQSPAKSKNGVHGTRFDFAYTPVGSDEAPRFYSVVLFVTDRHRVVLGVAGREEYRAQYSQQLDAIVGDFKVRGCKVASKLCKGEQPPTLQTSPPSSPNESSDSTATPASQELPLQPGPESTEA